MDQGRAATEWRRSEPRAAPEPLRIRRYRPEDRGALRQIACETGFHGRRIDTFYADRESFADWATAWFTDHEPERAFVVCRGEDRVGYLLLTVDARRAERFARATLRRHGVRRALWARPGTAGFFGRLAADLVRDGGVRRPAIDPARHPATLHANLLPEARGARIGSLLFRTAYESLRQAGVPGVHGAVNASNRAVIAAARRVGGRELGAPYPVPGLRAPDGSRVHGRMLVLGFPR